MIDRFEGKYAFLSNFFPSEFKYEGIFYPTNEHFFQAMKTLDIKERRAIANAANPGLAKHLGRTVTLRSDWEQIKEDVMLQGLRLKFTDVNLGNMLLDTGDEELVEGNWWGDQTWGVCRGVGENKLGKLLMQVRDELRRGW